MWLIAEYEAATLFSLKQSSATSSGGKTLLVPSPYAIKMALLDAACRTRGVTEAIEQWQHIRDFQVALRPAQRVVVTNLFQRVLRPRRNPAERDEVDAGPFQKTIGYREYAQWSGGLGIALGWTEGDPGEWLTGLLLNVNYLGKRGGFVQLIPPLQKSDALPNGFAEVTAKQTTFAVNGTLQILDDCAPELTFEQASIYSRAKFKASEIRIARHIVLPNYRLTRASKSFTMYERTE